MDVLCYVTAARPEASRPAAAAEAVSSDLQTPNGHAAWIGAFSRRLLHDRSPTNECVDTVCRVDQQENRIRVKFECFQPGGSCRQSPAQCSMFEVAGGIMQRGLLCNASVYL